MLKAAKDVVPNISEDIHVAAGSGSGAHLIGSGISMDCQILRRAWGDGFHLLADAAERPIDPTHLTAGHANGYI